MPFKNSGAGKKKQVADMFNKIASGYDTVNRFLSVRIDIRWRKKAINKLKEAHPKYILDVATGTADMAIMACKILTPEKVEGIDISENMLAIGTQKIEKKGLLNKIRLQHGDSETINFADNTFDAVMVAFGVRNFENLEKGLAEILRVLKPGGKLLVLEFSRPRRKAVSFFYSFYMKIVVPLVVRWFSQNKEAYQYLYESSNAFPDRNFFTDLLNKAGFTNTSFQPLTFGICCIYLGEKPY